LVVNSWQLLANKKTQLMEIQSIHKKEKNKNLEEKT